MLLQTQPQKRAELEKSNLHPTLHDLRWMLMVQVTHRVDGMGSSSIRHSSLAKPRLFTTKCASSDTKKNIKHPTSCEFKPGDVKGSHCQSNAAASSRSRHMPVKFKAWNRTHSVRHEEKEFS